MAAHTIQYLTMTDWNFNIKFWIVKSVDPIPSVRSSSNYNIIGSSINVILFLIVQLKLSRDVQTVGVALG